jgi:SAM-dependent methyltransferase
MTKKGKVETARELVLRALFRTKKDTDKNSRLYWNTRWLLNLQHDRLTSTVRSQLFSVVKELLSQHSCENVLEVGCGAIVPLRDLGDATHLDFSLKALKRSKLDSFICADITKRIPVPDKTFDATFSSCCLMHVPDESIALACAELKRVTKKLIILNEGSDRDLAGYFGGLVCEQPFQVPQEAEMEVGLR